MIMVIMVMVMMIMITMLVIMVMIVMLVIMVYDYVLDDHDYVCDRDRDGHDHGDARDHGYDRDDHVLLIQFAHNTCQTRTNRHFKIKGKDTCDFLRA